MYVGMHCSDGRTHDSHSDLSPTQRPPHANPTQSRFGHKFVEGEVARSVALQQHWLLQRLYMYLWRSGAMQKYNILLEQAEFRVRLKCMHTYMTSDAAVIWLICLSWLLVLCWQNNTSSCFLLGGVGRGRHTQYTFTKFTLYHKLC